MQVIEALISGVSGGELGTANLYRRGTVASAPWYADYDGTNANSTGSAIQLDANGGAEVYVNEPVRVVVKDTTGTTVREWDVMTPSSMVEVVSSSFTGQDYTTAASAVSKPAWLDSVLDLWEETNEAVDWKVKVGSTTNDIPFFLSKVLGIVINVKDEQYGAVGDGVTDDTAAISSALSAASSNPTAMVVFPTGTYVVSSSLNVGAGVSMVGMGPQATIITMDHATAYTLLVSGGGAERGHLIHGIAFLAEQANTGACIRYSSSTNVTFSMCEFGDGGNSTGTLVSPFGTVTAVHMAFQNCRFIVRGSSSKAIDSNPSVIARFNVTGCSFIPHTTQNASLVTLAGQGAVTNCFFGCGTSTAGTYNVLDVVPSAGRGISVTSCTFADTGGATVTAIRIIHASSNVSTHESGNTFGATLTAYSLSNATVGTYFLGSRKGRYLYIQDDSSAITLPTDQFEVILLERTVTGTVQLTAATQKPLGHRFTLITHNNSAGNVTIGMTAGWAADTSPVVATNTVSILEFVARDTLSGGSARFWQKTAAILTTAEF